MNVGLRNAITPRVNHLSSEGTETANLSDVGMRSFLVKSTHKSAVGHQIGFTLFKPSVIRKSMGNQSLY